MGTQNLSQCEPQPMIDPRARGQNPQALIEEIVLRYMPPESKESPLDWLASIYKKTTADIQEEVLYAIFTRIGVFVPYSKSGLRVTLPNARRTAALMTDISRIPNRTEIPQMDILEGMVEAYREGSGYKGNLVPESVDFGKIEKSELFEYLCHEAKRATRFNFDRYRLRLGFGAAVEMSLRQMREFTDTVYGASSYARLVGLDLWSEYLKIRNPKTTSPSHNQLRGQVEFLMLGNVDSPFLKGLIAAAYAEPITHRLPNCQNPYDVFVYGASQKIIPIGAVPSREAFMFLKL